MTSDTRLDALQLSARFGVEDFDADGSSFPAGSEASDAFLRLRGIFHRGGERSVAVGGRVDGNDISEIVEYLVRCGNEDNFMAVANTALSYLAWISFPTSEGSVSKSAEERACRAFFKASVKEVTSRDGLLAYTDSGRNDSYANEALVQAAYSTVYENMIGIHKLFQCLERAWVRNPAYQDLDRVSTLFRDTKKDLITKAADQLEIHRNILNISVVAINRLTKDALDWKSMGAMAKFINAEDAEESNEMTRHIRLIMRYMADNHLKRYMRTRPANNSHDTDSNSAFEANKGIREKISCEGIYRQLQVKSQPVKVIFDTTNFIIIGRYDQYFNEATGMFKSLPPGGAYRIGVACRGTSTSNESPGKIECCDLMHTKQRNEEDRWHYDGGVWLNKDNVDIDRQANGHSFCPLLNISEERRSIFTRGYTRHSTVTDLVDWWFSIENSAQAHLDGLEKPGLPGRVKEHMTTIDLPQEYTLEPADHIYMFADGYLVCEDVDIPLFYPLDDPAFKAGGKFANKDTLNVYSDVVFRADEYDTLCESVRENYTTHSGGPAYCIECGCREDLCVAWQDALLDAGADSVTLGDVADWFEEEGATDDDRDAGLDTAEAFLVDFAKNASRIQRICGSAEVAMPFLNGMTANAGHMLQVHDPVVLRPLDRVRDGERLCDAIDLGVLDNIILFQYDYRQPWEDLPQSLRVQGVGGRYWTEQVRRMRNEILYQWGRMYYRKGEFKTKLNNKDGTQNILGTIGLGGTGKSTALNMVKRGLNAAEVSVLDCTTFEPQFGVSQVLDKKFVAINEVETDSKTLTAGLIKQLCDGSLISAPVKNKGVRIGSMQAHVWFLGNERLFSTDPSGALSRRFAVMNWQREVQKKDMDPTLERKFNLHFGHAIAVFHLKYWHMMEKFSCVDIWHHNGDMYPFMSWLWHAVKEKGEAESSKLASALQHFRGARSWWCFSPKSAVENFTAPKVVVGQNGLLVLEPADNPSWFEEEDAVALLEGAPPTRKLPIAYMPLDRPEGSGKYDGFKQKYYERLKDAFPGTHRKDDINWQKGYDFYGRAFTNAGIAVKENISLPWPMEGTECITANWVIGCTTEDAFSKDDTGRRLWESLRRDD